MFARRRFNQFLLEWLTQEKIPFNLELRKNNQGHDLRVLTANQGYGDTVIYLHGMGDDLFFPGSLILKHLIEHGFEILTFDLNGHGKNSNSVLDIGTFRNFFAENKHLIPHKKTNKKLFFIGHSLGGALALYAEAKGHIKADGIVAIGCPYSLKKPGLHNLASEVLHSCSLETLMLLKQFSLLDLLPAVGGFKRSEYPIRLKHPKLEKLDYIEVISEIFSSLQPNDKNSNSPVLMISGDKDSIAAPSNCQKWATNFQNFQHVKISKLSHFGLTLHFDSHVTITSWLNGIGKTRIIC